MKIQNINTSSLKNTILSFNKNMESKNEGSGKTNQIKNINNKNVIKTNKNENSALQSLLQAKTQLEETLSNLKNEQSEMILEYKTRIDELQEKIETYETPMRNDITSGFLKDYEEFCQNKNSDDIKVEEKQDFFGCGDESELIDKINSMDIGYSIIQVEEFNKKEEVDKLRQDMKENEGLEDIYHYDKEKNEDIDFKRQALSYCEDEDKNILGNLTKEKIGVGRELALYIAQSQKQISQVENELESVNCQIAKVTAENKSDKKDNDDRSNEKYDVKNKINERNKILRKIRMNLDPDLLREIDINMIVNLI